MNEYPVGVRRKDFEFGLYNLTRRDPSPRGPIAFEIGTNDDLAVVRFHARERQIPPARRFAGADRSRLSFFSEYQRMRAASRSG